jgi:hypothetical protein
MCDQTLIFVKILETLASTGETFPFQERVKVLTLLLFELTEGAYDRHNCKYNAGRAAQLTTIPVAPDSSIW